MDVLPSVAIDGRARPARIEPVTRFLNGDVGCQERDGASGGEMISPERVSLRDDCEILDICSDAPLAVLRKMVEFYLMRTRIKVCCIASVEEARIAIDAGADALGLVGAMPSGPGPIPDDRIAEIAAFAPPPIATFLLTSEQKADAISAHIRRTNPTTVQIVSHIDPVQSARLAVLEPHLRRVQVIHVEGPSALDLMTVYAPHVHAFLLDSGRPGAATPELGGTGRKHDWDVSMAFVRACPLPVFLAGGLSAANAADAIERVHPFGLDLCSGVRTNGRLDATRLSDFVQAAQRADSALASG